LSLAALRAYYPHVHFGHRIIPVPEWGTVYVKNPKAATSTVTLWLHRLYTGDLAFTPTGIIGREHQLPRAFQVGWPRVIDMLEGSAYRFTFVRHPLHRLESAYRDKILSSQVGSTGSRDWAQPFRERLGLGSRETASLTFDQFLTVLEEQDPVSEMDPHFRPQHVNLMYPLVNYDRIGRVETFDADLERIRDEAGLPKVPFEVLNASRVTNHGSVFDGRPDRIRRAEQIYAKDFELYGYKRV
jgi:hypothetical protein